MDFSKFHAVIHLAEAKYRQLLERMGHRFFGAVEITEL